jgi:hypothetical protein
MKNLLYLICLASSISFLALCSCKLKAKEEIVLKIINPEVYSYGYNYQHGNHIYKENSKQVLRYSIVNNGGTTYYFNQNVRFLKKYYGIRIEGIAELIIKDDKGIVIQPKYSTSDKLEGVLNCSEIKKSEFDQKVKDMGYEPKIYSEIFFNNKGFFIHPNETLYFEDILILPGNHERGKIKFNKGTKYTAQLEIFSDSTTYKSDNTRSLLMTIKANGYKVFNGTIKSDKIPVVFKSLD